LCSPTVEYSKPEAVCEGRIAHERRGNNGFGYDPVLEVTEETIAPAEFIGQTMAEVPPQVKAQISHRARAVAAMKNLLETKQQLKD
jgi:XTP/dITP diphosphohydrolase